MPLPPLVEPGDVVSAAARIAGLVRRTPVLDVDLDDGTPVTLKLELLQHTGSFKVRGMFNRLLVADVPAAGVVIASGGNAGLAAAYAASRLGHRATVFLPATAPAAKTSRVHQLGADVHLTGREYAEALAASRSFAAEKGALELHAYDDPDVVAGQGKCGLELADQRPDLDTVLVAVGGGGLIGGIAAAYAGGAAVIGVEPERCPTLDRALAAGAPVDVAVGGVAADALGARRIGTTTWSIVDRDRAAGGRPWLHSGVLVADDDIVAAQRWLWERVRLVAEPAGAAALAPLLSGAHRPEPGTRTGVIVCGANTDPANVGLAESVDPEDRA